MPDPPPAHWPPPPSHLRRNHSLMSAPTQNLGGRMSMDRSTEVLVRPWQSSASVPSIWSQVPWSSDVKEDTEDRWPMPRKYSLYSNYDPMTRTRVSNSPPPDLLHSSRNRHLRALDTPRHSAPQTFLEATIAKLGADAHTSTSETPHCASDEPQARPRTVSATSAWPPGPGVDDAALKPHRWPSLASQEHGPMLRTGSLGSYDLSALSRSSTAHRGRRPTPLKESGMDPSGAFGQLSLQDANPPPQSPTSPHRPWVASDADVNEGLAPDAHSAPSLAHIDAIPSMAPVIPAPVASMRPPAPAGMYMIPPNMPIERPLWTSTTCTAPYGQANLMLPVPLPQRAFVIKSFTEVDVQRSMQHGIWTSTEKGNQRLDRAWRHSHAAGPIYLFFSVNGSGCFCGMAQMTSGLDYNQSSDIWADGTRWKGLFHVHWLLVKDVPNAQLRHIILHNTADVRPVTKSRDTQELLPEAAMAVLQIFYTYTGFSSLLSRDTSPMPR